jgi:hypothetical protein
MLARTSVIAAQPESILILQSHVRAVLVDFVIPAKAGIQLFASSFGFVARTDSRPCVFHAHPCARVTFSCLPKRK